MMKIKPILQKHTGLWLALIAMLLLAACSGPVERQWVKTPGWSRAALIGTTSINDPAPFALDEEGTAYFLLFMDAGDGQTTPRVRAYNYKSELALLWQQDIDFKLQRPTRAQILYDGRLLYLYWVDESRLYTASMGVDGALAAPPQLISGDATVERFAAASTADGRVSVWYAGPRRAPGLWLLEDGKASKSASSEARLVDPEGQWPSLFVDSQGTLHAVWAHVPNGYGDMRIFYASYPQGNFVPDRQTLIFEESFMPATILQGPWIGVTDDTTYLVWTKEVKTGMDAGATGTLYTAFPNGQPAQIVKPQTIDLPDESRLTYAAPSTGASLQAGERYALANAASLSNALTEISINPSPASELAIAVHSMVEYQWRQMKGQVSLAYLRDGIPMDYQLISFTNLGATAPFLTSDEEGYLTLSWLEKSAEPGFLVYFAGTHPNLVAAQSRLSTDDIGRLAMETVFGMIIGAVLSPLFGALALAPTLLVMLLTTPLRRENDRTRIDPGTVISLALCLIVYWAVKYFSLLGVGSYIPFSAWIPNISSAAGAALQVIVPLIILGVALKVAWHFTFARETKSILYFLLIYVAVDALLTLSIYGVLIYDAF